MSFMHGQANLFQNVHRPVKRQAGFFGEHIAERTTIQVFHYQVSDALRSDRGKTEISYINKVRMSQAAGSASFAFEPFDELRVTHELRRNQFQSHISFRSEVAGQEYGAHTTLTEQPFEPVFLVECLTYVMFKRSHGFTLGRSVSVVRP